MTKTRGRKASKRVASMSKKASRGAKNVASKSKKSLRKVKSKTQNLLAKAKKKLSNIKKTSAKGLTRSKDKVYATEKEILEYVKENPVKSISAVALTGLIAGFISRLRK